LFIAQDMGTWDSTYAILSFTLYMYICKSWFPAEDYRNGYHQHVFYFSTVSSANAGNNSLVWRVTCPKGH